MTDADRKTSDIVLESGRIESLRLLPWTGEGGKPCFLSGHGTGYVAQVADDLEAEQLDSAAELLTEARGLLAARSWTQGELHLLAVNLTEALGDVHRIAESRGARLPVPDEDEDGDEARDGDEAQDAAQDDVRNGVDEGGADATAPGAGAPPAS